MRCPLMHPNPTRAGCDWCGAPLRGRQRRWHSAECERAWWNNHVWTYARDEALRRAEVRDEAGVFVGFRCVHCDGVFRTPATRRATPGRVALSGGAVEVNHKRPIGGRHGESGCHHHQSGLEVLCPPCHRDVTARQRAVGWREVEAPEATLHQEALFA